MTAPETEFIYHNENHIEKVKRFFTSPGSKVLGILVVLVLVAAIPLTVRFAQQQQQGKQNAAETCTGIAGRVALNTTDPISDAVISYTSQQHLTTTVPIESSGTGTSSAAVFNPNSLTIMKGTTVLWKNTTASTLAIDSSTAASHPEVFTLYLAPHGSAQHTFTTIGTYSSIALKLWSNRSTTLDGLTLAVQPNPVGSASTDTTGNYCIASPQPMQGSATFTLTLQKLGGYHILSQNPQFVTLTTVKPTATINFTVAKNAVTPSPSPKSSPSPSPSKTPTPSPSGTVSVTLGLTLALQAIGDAGSNTASHGGNLTPKTPQRPVTVELFNQKGVRVGNPVKGTVTYNAETKLFTGSVPLTKVSVGDYQIKVQSSRYLKRLLPGFAHLVSGVNLLPQTTLVVGDINTDNKMDILDYNVLSDCFGDKSKSAACLSHPDHVNADVNDDGVIDGVDYNIFISNISSHQGD